MLVELTLLVDRALLIKRKLFFGCAKLIEYAMYI